MPDYSRKGIVVRLSVFRRMEAKPKDETQIQFKIETVSAGGHWLT